MAFQLSPGVSVSEIDLTTRTPIPSVSDGAFAGNFNWGPAEDVTLITNENDLIELFGKPDDITYKSVLTCSSFLSYSNKLRIVRSININSALNSTTSGSGVFIKNNTDYEKNYENKSDGSAVFYAKYPGVLGDSLKISMCLPDRANTQINSFEEVELSPNTDIELVGTFDSEGTLANTDIEATLNSDTTVDVELRVGDVVYWSGGTGIVTAVTNSTYFSAETTTGESIGGTTALSADTIYRMKRSAFSEPSRNMLGTISLASATGDRTVIGDGTRFTLQILPGDILSFTDSFGINVKRRVVSIEDDTHLTLSAGSRDVTAGTTFSREWEYASNFQGPPITSKFAYQKTGNKNALDEIHVILVDAGGSITGKKDSRANGLQTTDSTLETYANLSVINKALGTSTGESLYYKDVINSRSKYLRWGAHDAVGSVYEVNGNNITVDGWGSDVQIGNTNFTFQGSFSTSQSANGVITKTFGGGHDGQNTTEADIIRGYTLLRDPETVDAALILTGETTNAVANYLVTDFAEFRKDCVVFLSPEESDVVNLDSNEAVEKIIARRNNSPSSSYAVMDGNYKYMFDRYNAVYRYIPFNGDVAGLCAQSDNTNPFISPAGFNRGNLKNVDKLALNPNRAERDELYTNGINPIVAFPGKGRVLLGDKTMLAKPSAFDRINVRRLFIAVEKAIANAAQFSLFEFNDQFTRAQFRAIVEPFLRQVQSRRGITDFRVICDETNNPPAIVDSNQFRGDIYIKPSRSINFINLNFVAVSSGVEFSEIVDAI